MLTVGYAPVGSHTSVVHLTLTGRAAGAVWQCDLDEPGLVPTRACAAPGTGPTSCVQVCVKVGFY